MSTWQRFSGVLEQGATWTFKCIFTEDGTPIDLTGYTARLGIKSSLSLTEYDVFESKVIAVPGENSITGQVVFKTAKEDTLLDEGEYKIEIDLMDPAGERAKLFKRDANIRGSVLI